MTYNIDVIFNICKTAIAINNQAGNNDSNEATNAAPLINAAARYEPKENTTHTPTNGATTHAQTTNGAANADGTRSGWTRKQRQVRRHQRKP